MHHILRLTLQTKKKAPCPPHTSRFASLARAMSILAVVALLAGVLFSANTASAQPTLMFRLPMDGPNSSATSTSNDASGLFPAGSIVLSTFESISPYNGNAAPAPGPNFNLVDLRGAANS